MTSSACPCCSTRLLHHISNQREYWFCRHCWQEMPNVSIDKYQQYREYSRRIDLSIKINSSTQTLLTSSH